jgi:hypothetical protein
MSEIMQSVYFLPLKYQYSLSLRGPKIIKKGIQMFNSSHIILYL